MPRKTKANPTDPTWVFRREFATEIPGVTRHRASDEMHSREYLSSGPDASDEAFWALLTPKPSVAFDDFARGLREKVNAALVKDGWPPGEMRVLVAGDRWKLLIEKPPLGSDSVSTEIGFRYTIARCKEFSAPWFLAKIAEALFRLEHAVGDERCWAIYDLARLLEVREHRVHYPKVLHAVNHRRGVVAGAATNMIRNKENRDAVVNETRDFLRERPKEWTAAATHCLELGLGTTVAGNIKYWKRYGDPGQ